MNKGQMINMQFNNIVSVFKQHYAAITIIKITISMQHILTIFKKNAHNFKRSAIEIEERENIRDRNIQDNFIDSSSLFTQRTLFQSYHPGLLEYIIFVFFSRVLKPDMLQADKGRSKGEIMEMCRKFERTSFEP